MKWAILIIHYHTMQHIKHKQKQHEKNCFIQKIISQIEQNADEATIGDVPERDACADRRAYVFSEASSLAARKTDRYSAVFEYNEQE